MHHLKVGIIHNQPVPEGEPNWESSVDVLVQVEAIEASLAELAIPSVRIPFSRDLAAFVARVREEAIAVAVNLCESVNDDPLLVGHPAAVLELLRIPFTGSSAMALLLSTDKLTVKRLLAASGIRTPPFFLYEGGEVLRAGSLNFPVIMKPRFQDASIGIEQESVLRSSKGFLARLEEFHARYGAILVEEYVAGREFNVALFGYPKPRVMPLAEIDFSAFPPDLHRIVSYKAKWDEESFEYHHTPRYFPDNLPEPLQRAMRRVARDSFALFGLRDYGRVDLRLDALGRINILEINANPCLSPDAGFAAAVAESKMNYTEMVGEFIRFVAMRVPL
ncbi:D-alanine--D-alanine ligase family protein [Thiovibrio sp. JS02]